MILKVSAAAVTAALCAATVRRGAPEFALLLTLAAGCWMLLSVADGLKAVADTLEQIVRVAGLDRSVVEPVFKTVALALITRITAEVCRAAGEGGIAAFTEAAGTISALVVSLPLVGAVLAMLEELM